MQVSVKNTDIVGSHLTDYSPITFSYCKNEESNVENIDYKVCKQQLDAMSEEKPRGVKNSSKCNWYELVEKSTKFFSTCKNVVQSKVKYILLLTKMKLHIRLK